MTVDVKPVQYLLITYRESTTTFILIDFLAINIVKYISANKAYVMLFV